MLNLTNITVSFGGRDLYKNISFQINAKDKIGVVGKNGAGKSTMLKLITGEQKASSGQINSVKSLSIGYLPQELNVESENSILNEFIGLFGYDPQMWLFDKRKLSEILFGIKIDGFFAGPSLALTTSIF